MTEHDWIGYENEQDAETSRALHEEKLLNGVKESLKSPDGRYFLRWLVDSSGLLSASYPQEHALAAYREVQRSVGAAVFALLVKAGATNILE